MNNKYKVEMGSSIAKCQVKFCNQNDILKNLDLDFM